MHGLRQLEYRGYDSAGLAVIDAGGCIQVRREAGKLTNLEQLLADNPVRGAVGVGHRALGDTRPAQPPHDAHPHSSPDGDLVVVQNGIVENFLELRQQLQDDGYAFQSDTDTEVIQTVSDWDSTPVRPSKTMTAPSKTLRERSTSAVKSICPGVSIIFTR